MNRKNGIPMDKMEKIFSAITKFEGIIAKIC